MGARRRATYVHWMLGISVALVLAHVVGWLIFQTVNPWSFAGSLLLVLGFGHERWSLQKRGHDGGRASGGAQ